MDLVTSLAAGMREVVRELRRQGPMTLVEVRTEDAGVVVKIL